MDINKIILNYLRDINPSAIDRIENPGSISIARIVDSLGMLEFLSFIEQTFSINIDDGDVLDKNFNTIDSVVEFVKMKKSSSENNKERS